MSSSDVRPSLLFDFCHTIFLSIIILVLSVVATRLFAVQLGPEGFGHFQLARRVVNYAFPLFFLGLNTALVRQISYAQDPYSKFALQLAGLLVTLLGCCIVIIMTYCCSRCIGHWIFHAGGAGGKEVLLLILGTLVFAYQYAVFRATNRLLQANLLLLLIMGLLPTALAFTAQNGRSNAFALVGELAKWSIALASLPIVYTLLKNEGINMIRGSKRAGIIAPFRCLTGYGIKRIPVPILMGIIYSGGAVALNSHGSAEAAGLFLAALFLVRVVEQAVGPVAIVMLPRLAEYAGKNDNVTIRNYVIGVLDHVFAIGTFTSIQIIIIANDIISCIYGSSYTGAVTVFRILAVAILPVLFFSLVQTVIDSISEKAIVFYCVLSGSLVSLGGFCFLDIYTPVSAAVLFVISIYFVAAGMFWYLMRFLNLPLLTHSFQKLLLVNIAAGLTCMFICYGMQEAGMPSWTIILVSMGAAFIIYFGLSIRWNLSWIRTLKNLTKHS